MVTTNPRSHACKLARLANSRTTLEGKTVPPAGALSVYWCVRNEMGELIPQNCAKWWNGHFFRAAKLARMAERSAVPLLPLRNLVIKKLYEYGAPFALVRPSHSYFSWLRYLISHHFPSSFTSFFLSSFPLFSFLSYTHGGTVQPLI